MRNKKLRAVLIISLIIISGFVAAQLLNPGAPLPAEFFPPNAIVYWETANLKEFLVWWKNSTLKNDWQITDNYKTFQNSRLFLRLQERIDGFSKDKINFSLDNLIKLAGKRSALAVYDIGDLKALAVTELSQADASLTELWIQRSKFKEKTFGTHKYYVEPEEGKLAFAYAKPYLVISTESGLLEQFLQNTAEQGETTTLSDSEKWTACRPENLPLSLFSIYLDQETLNSNRYFKKYWIHQNAKEFSSIRSVWIDFLAEPHGLIEHRYFALTDEKPAPAESQTIEWAEPFRKLTADYLSIEPSPDPVTVAESTLKMLNRFPEAQKETSYPPPYSASYTRASEAEIKNPYLVNINDPVLQPADVQILQVEQPKALASLLASAKPAASIKLRTPIWDKDGLFLSFQETQALLLENFDSLPQEQFLDQLKSYFLLLASGGENGAVWIQKPNGTYSLHSLNTIHVKLQKPWVILSTNENDLNKTAAVLPTQATAPQSSLVEIDWQKGRWKYSRLMKRLDYGTYKGTEPFFFSENLDSLFNALYSIKKSTIEKSDHKEVVHYEVQ